MISRRIGKCLFILLIVYLTVTVYIASTMLLSTSTGVVDTDYGSPESNDEDDMSNMKTNIFNEEKYQLFRIKNSESRKSQRQTSMNTTTKKVDKEFLFDNIKTPEVKMGRQISKTKDVNVKVMLDEWKKKMELLRHEHLENGYVTKLMHLKRILVNAPGASNTGNINAPNQNNEEENTKKLVNKNNIVMDRRRNSVDAYKDLPRYHLNMQSIPGEIKVYSAFLDERKPTKFIRIVLIGIRLEPKKSTVCKFLLADRSNHTVTSQMTLYETCEGHNKYFTSYIGSCEIPGIDILLDQVGLAVDGGDMDLFMKVIDNGKKKTTEMQNFAICVPPLFGDVNVLRLTEFIELYRILGAQHFVFYPKFVSSEISSLLDHYQSLGIATVMLWNLTIPLNDIWYHGQSASVWDCLYRTMFKFRHVAFIDFDEFIVPKMQNTLPEFLTYLQEEQNINDEIISAYKFQSAFFDPKFFNDDDMPKSMEMQRLATMNRTQRTRKLSKIRTKLVVNPVNIFEVGIHHVSKPNEEHYQCLDINPKLAFIHHYRECKGDYGMNCKLTTRDTSMLKYNTSLVNGVKQHLGAAKLHRPPV
ncbi:beta-1,4-galactosyltransferase galt-1-like [Mizuhopecten yessoensis]|uniref:Glycosyltransferase family 92 protein n=1 Tax=Mizuhopecten yessoensis TaxID=6573 RepID=A0A210PJE2_MIZYE|nr:beta-1,4-galactosyltransferase galt-1-like [Mizuhopecten yessoensis]OWF36611.1 UPF0392 protein F13G3.3 [Mizuhopecten yessoensis]